jgi:DNA ligase (NAD+)
MAEGILQYFNNQQNVIEIQKLKNLGIETLGEVVAEGVFKGEKVVLTGTLNDYKRDEAIKIIESLGGEIMSAVSKGTTLLIAGEKAGSKLDKANKLGIKIIDEETFKSLVKT